MLIDSHCHLDDPQFGGRQAALIAAAIKAGVTDCVVPATTVSSLQRIADLAGHYESVHPAYGLHPWFLDQHEPDATGQLASWIDNHPPVAIGECGLDFSRGDRDSQERLFTAQIELAQLTGLPLIIHAHKALDRAIQLLRNFPGTVGVIHRFSGSREQALEKLLLESDAPDLPPARIPDPLNAPHLLPLTLKVLAELLDEPLDEVARQTTLNTQQLFSL